MKNPILQLLALLTFYFLASPVAIALTKSCATEMTVSRHTKAQQLFNDGMLNYYGYLYVQAEYDFRQAIIHDPACGMCYVGLALAKKQQALELNLPFAKLGIDDLQKAMSLVSKRQGFEYDIAKAVYTSFTLNPQITEKQLQFNYINAMQNVYHHYKDDPKWQNEALAFYTDAIAYYPAGDEDGSMENHCGRPLNDIIKNIAVGLLKNALSKNVYHPGILHTYIHLTERDLNDPLAWVAVKQLPFYSQGKIAHYTHMPNHIYWRRGFYDKAIQANLDAIKIDQHYFSQGGIGLNSYYYEYHYLHYYHFLTTLGILTNQFTLAIDNARMIKQLMDGSRLESLPDYRDTLLTLEHLTLLRFNKWNAALKVAPIPQAGEPGQLFIEFTHALSYLQLNQLVEFKQTFQKIKARHISRKNLKNMQTLILTYLTVSKMAKEQQPFSSLEKIIEKNGISAIEKELFSRNPPLWFFPYSLLLSDIAFERGNLITAKKYHDQFNQLYPKSRLGLFVVTPIK